MSKSIRSKYPYLISAALVLLTLAVYWQVRNHDFVNYDDNLYVTDNPHVKAGLTLESIKWAFTTGHSANWHPLTWLSHMLDVELFGMNPGWHHLMSMLIHIVNTLLLFYVLKRMTGSQAGLWQSAFVAALFALHPLHVESVAWAAERKDVLSTFFWMLTMLAYARYVEKPGTGRYLLVALALALGLMAKPMLVTLPFVLLLLDFWPLNRMRVPSAGEPARLMSGGDKSRVRRTKAPVIPTTIALQLVREKLPLFGLIVLSGIVTYEVQQAAGAFKYAQTFPLDLRIGNGLLSYVAYIGMTIWPSDLAVLYPHRGMSPGWTLVTIPGWKVAGAALLLIAVSVLVFKLVRRHPYLSVGWLWYLGSLVPVIGLVQVGTQAMADRYMYVPIIGLFIMVAWGIPQLLRQWRQKKVVLAFAGALVLLGFTIWTWKQIGHWKNSITLFQHAVAVTKINPVAHYNLGYALFMEKRHDEAIPHFSEAIRIAPTYNEARNMLTLAQQAVAK